MPVPEHLSSRERFLSAKNLGITGKLKITGNRGACKPWARRKCLFRFSLPSRMVKRIGRLIDQLSHRHKPVSLSGQAVENLL